MQVCSFICDPNVATEMCRRRHVGGQGYPRHRSSFGLPRSCGLEDAVVLCLSRLASASDPLNFSTLYYFDSNMDDVGDGGQRGLRCGADHWLLRS